MGFMKTGRVGLGDNAQPDSQPTPQPEPPVEQEEDENAD